MAANPVLKQRNGTMIKKSAVPQIILTVNNAWELISGMMSKQSAALPPTPPASSASLEQAIGIKSKTSAATSVKPAQLMYWNKQMEQHPECLLPCF
jgi:hypothetical protein